MSTLRLSTRAFILVCLAVLACAFFSSEAQAVPVDTAPPTLVHGTSVEVGKAIEVSIGSWEDTEPITYSYQWEDCNAEDENCAAIAEANGESYTPTEGDVGRILRAIVTASDGEGETVAESEASEVVPDVAPSNTTAPELSTQEAVVGTPLSVSEGSWSGSKTIAYSYQWQDCSHGSCSPIAGADEASYTPSESEAGDELSAIVTAKNAAGSKTAKSEETEAIPAMTPTNTLAPALSSEEAVVGVALSVSSGEWSEHAGAGNITYSYQWWDCHFGTREICTEIAGADDESYTPQISDEGLQLRVSVTATNQYATEEEPSNESAVVVAKAPKSISPPSISSNVPSVGVQLEVSSGEFTGTAPIVYSYKWEDCGSRGEGCAAIPGATMASYIPQSSDSGHALKVIVLASNAGGSDEASSVLTNVVPSPPAGSPPSPAPKAPTNSALPTLSSASPLVGSPLVVSTGRWNETVSVYTYQWWRCHTSGLATTEGRGGCFPIGGAVGSIYVPSAADLGYSLFAAVTASNSSDLASSASSAHSNAVTATPPKLTTKVVIKGKPERDQILSVNVGKWSGASPIKFSYRWQREEGSRFVDIPKATRSVYRLGSKDKKIRVVVVASGPSGSAHAVSQTVTVLSSSLNSRA
jgi:hypothetical protein